MPRENKTSSRKTAFYFSRSRSRGAEAMGRGRNAVIAVAGSFVEADGREEPGFAAAIDVKAWQRLMLHGLVQLGGLRSAGARPAAAPTPTSTARTTVPQPL